MFISHELSFQKGSIITSDLLETMYRQPIVMIEMLFQDYSDGIISGMDLVERDQTLSITKGIYKHKGKIYYSEADISLTPKSGDFVSGQKYAVVIEEKSISKSTSISQYQLIIDTVPYDKNINEENFLFIFRGTPDLPKKIDKADTFCNDKLDLSYFRRSTYGEKATYCPYIFKLIYKKLKGISFKDDMLDFLIMNDIQMYGYVPVELMHSYVMNHTQKNEQCKKNNCFSDRKEFLKSFIESIITPKYSEENTNDKNVSLDCNPYKSARF